MKIKIIITCLLGLLGFLSQNAFAWPLEANCNFNQAKGECSVYNQTNRPIRCNLRINGQVSSGYWFRGRESVNIYPGQYAYTYVYANNPQFDPLIFTNGSANCRF